MGSALAALAVCYTRVHDTRPANDANTLKHPVRSQTGWWSHTCTQTAAMETLSSQRFSYTNYTLQAQAIRTVLCK